MRFEGVRGLPACPNDGWLVVGLRLFIGHISKTHDETATSRHLNSDTICISAESFLLSRAVIDRHNVQPHLDIPFSMDQSLSMTPTVPMAHGWALLSPYLIFSDNHAHRRSVCRLRKRHYVRLIIPSSVYVYPLYSSLSPPFVTSVAPLC